MAEQVRTERLNGRSTGEEPSWAELLDPAALEARLSEARARRAEVLALKNGGDGEPKAQDPIRPTPIPMPPRQGHAAAPQPVPAPPASGVRRPAEPVYIIPPRPVEPAQNAAAPEPLIAEQRIVPAKTGAKSFTTLLLSTIFIVGLLGGGVAALLAPPAFRQKLADMIAPATNEQVAERSIAPASIEVEAVSGAPAGDDSTRTLDDWSATPLGSPLNSPAEAGPSAQVIPPVAATGSASAPQAVVLAPELLASTRAEAFPGSPGADAGWAAHSDPRSVEIPGSAGAQFDHVSRLASLAPRPVEVEPEPDAAPGTLDQVTLLKTARVFVHFPLSARSTATAAVETLRAAGAGEANSLPLGYAIGSSNVRYYRAEDRDAAMAVVEILRSSMPDAPELRDFTDYRPQPNPGVIEAFLAGESPRAAATTRAPAADSAAAQALGATGAAEAEAVERILMQRTVERMLREQQLRN